MRKFLLATSAAALALTFSGHGQRRTRENSCRRDHGRAAGNHDRRRPGVLQGRRSGQADRQAGRTGGAPGASPAANGQARRSKPLRLWLRPRRLSAEDAAVADRLRDLAENKLQQYVPQAQDRAGVLAFYRARNFAPIWTASGKPAPRAEQAARFPAQGRGRRPRSGGLSGAELRQCRSGQARRRRAGADEFRRHLRASRQHRPRGVHAGERRGLFRPEGAERSRRAGQARRQHRRPRHARRVQSAGTGIQGAQGPACRGPQRPELRAQAEPKAVVAPRRRP